MKIYTSLNWLKAVDLLCLSDHAILIFSREAVATSTSDLQSMGIFVIHFPCFLAALSDF